MATDEKAGFGEHEYDFAAAARTRPMKEEIKHGPSLVQPRVHQWMLACFGAEIAADKTERNHRFIEEALELVQAGGCTASEAHQLVEYVFGLPVGENDQEVGGVMVTLAALCTAFGLDMQAAAEREIMRINRPEMIERIRAKQAGKPKHSPLPVQSQRCAIGEGNP